jgi:hypothetical protein
VAITDVEWPGGGISLLNDDPCGVDLRQPVGRFAAAHRVAPQLDAVGIVDKPVEDGVGIGRIADRVVPALDWDLRSQDRGGTLVAIVDDLHQVATLLSGKPGHGPIVDYEQLYPGELGEQPGGLAVDAGDGELVEKPGKPLIAHREPATRGLVAGR